MKKAIFITGERGVGKSTSLFAVAKKIIIAGEHEIRGFKTFFKPGFNPRESFLCFSEYFSMDYDDSAIKLATRSEHDGTRTISAERAGFEKAASLLKNTECRNRIFLMDEIGFLEEDFGEYRDALASKIEESVFSMLVVRKGKYDFINSLKRKYAFGVFEIDLSNRESCADFIYMQSKEIISGGI